MSRSVQVVDPATFVGYAAATLATALRDPPAAGLSLALSGGTTPGPVYSRLAREGRIEWERLRVFFADERAVPPTDPASNYRLVRDTLIDHLRAPPHVIRMEADDPDLEAAARRYAGRLPDALDLLVLGIGADGHTASLFPGSPILAERERRVAVAESPSPPRMRLTITPPVIRSARRVVVLARGAEKADAVRRALQSPVEPVGVSAGPGPSGPTDPDSRLATDPDSRLATDPDSRLASCPARLAANGVWIVDEEAAAGLRR